MSSSYRIDGSNVIAPYDHHWEEPYVLVEDTGGLKIVSAYGECTLTFMTRLPTDLDDWHNACDETRHSVTMPSRSDSTSYVTYTCYVEYLGDTIGVSHTGANALNFYNASFRLRRVNWQLLPDFGNWPT